MLSCIEIKKALLLGCGHDRRRRVRDSSESADLCDCDLTTIDINPNCGADIIHDLSERPLPFADESFDEIHAYDVLEHWGSVGDFKGWFDEMSEYWRLLKPEGTFSAIVPIGEAAFSDPGHTRFFHQNHFGFLTADFYEQNRAKKTAATDYRWYIKHWWKIEYLEEQIGECLAVVLRKV